MSHSLAIDVAVSRVPPRSQSLADLSSRELDTLALLAKGKTYSHIARELSVSYKTVVNISWLLKKKLGVDNLSALVQRAIELLPSPDALERRSKEIYLPKDPRIICKKIPAFSRNNIYFHSRESRATIFVVGVNA